MRKNKRMRQGVTVFLAIIAVLASGCGSDVSEQNSGIISQPGVENGTGSNAMDEVMSGIKTEIICNGESASIDGSGCYIWGGVLTIDAEGTYVISGVLENGQILVDAGKNSEVNLVLNGVTVTSDNSAALFVKKAEKVNIYLAGGSENIFTDGEVYTYTSEEEEPNAAIYSKCDLAISGTGKLVVVANYNDGLVCKDSMTLLDGVYDITSVGDAVVGKDCLLISGGNFQITAGGGAKNGESHFSGMDRGFFGGWNVNSKVTEDEASKKGLKSDLLIQIEDGGFVIDSCDDAIHSNDAVVINGGSFTIASGDDGIHAETELFINDGLLKIENSYEGLEALDITVNGGEIYLVATDDGINAAESGEETTMDSSNQGFFGGRGGMGGFGMMEDTSASLTVNGGFLRVNAAGDGLDANGGIMITGGAVYVDGPVNSGNGSLDYATTCIVDGGILVAAGSVGMAQAVNGDSVQAAISYTSETMVAGTIVKVTDASGNELVSYTSEKQFQNIVISAPGMKQGETVVLSVNGEEIDVELNGTVTYAGISSGGGFGGNGGFGGGMNRPGGRGGR